MEPPAGPPRIGPYVLRGELGRGGMGTVYRARRDGAATDVALKVIAAGADASPEHLVRFRREVGIAQELEDPGIVRFLEHGESGDRTWFAMELVEGVSLRHARRDLYDDWRRAVEIVRDTARALEHAHARGVVHRDLKPANILLDRAGRPRITDFGLAKNITTGSRFTQSGQTLGTPQYMSPEQARGELGALTPASDVWGLGAVLYELVTGERAFDGDTPAVVVGRILTERPHDAGRLRPDLPKPVAAVITACLQVDPAARYPSGGELADALDGALAGQAPKAGRPGAPRRGRRAAPWAVFAAVALAAGFAAWWLTGPTPPEGAPATASNRTAAATAARRSKAEALAERAHRIRFDDPRKAGRLLLQALALEPDRHAWRLELALTAWNLGDGPRARQEWMRIPAGAPEFEEAQLLRTVEICFRENDGYFDYSLAIDDVRALADRTGRAGRIGGALKLLVSNRFPDALEAIGDCPGWEADLIRAFLISRVSRDADAAITAYDRVLAAGIRLPWIHLDRGAILLTAERPGEALPEIERGLQLLPDSIMGRVNLVGALVLLGRRDEAERALARLEAEHPTDPRVTMVRGDMLQAAGRLPEAIAQYTSALDVPEHNLGGVHMDRSLLYYKRGNAYRLLDQWDKAELDFSDALGENPRFLAARINRGSARLRVGNYAGGLRDLQRVVELQPERASNWFNCANARRLVNDLPGAIRDYSRAVQLAPRDAGFRNNRGVTYMMLKDYGHARDDLLVAADLEPDDARNWSNLGIVYMKVKQWQSAIDVFEKFLKLEPHGRQTQAARNEIARCRAQLAAGGGR